MERGDALPDHWLLGYGLVIESIFMLPSGCTSSAVVIINISSSQCSIHTRASKEVDILSGPCYHWHPPHRHPPLTVPSPASNDLWSISAATKRHPPYISWDIAVLLVLSSGSITIVFALDPLLLEVSKVCHLGETRAVPTFTWAGDHRALEENLRGPDGFLPA